MDIWQTVLGCLFGGGLIGLIEFLIRRSDEKKNKNDEVLAAIKSVTEMIEAIEARMERDNADDARRNILAFDDELRRRTDHSEESFNQVITDIKFYKQYCRLHADYENDRATSAMAHILEVYQYVKNNNMFI